MVLTEFGEFATLADARVARAAAQAKAAVAPPVLIAEPQEPAPAVATARPATDKRGSLVARTRPRTLAEVVGQPTAVAQLAAYVANPVPRALILAGDTGTGKTSAAWAIAADLGCDCNAIGDVGGGVYEIMAGEQRVKDLNTVWPLLWQKPFYSARGWKVLIINELETPSGTYERWWLDNLEALPPHTFIIFTTNSLDTLPRRLRSRCNVVKFRSSADDLLAAARELARKVYREETGTALSDSVLVDVLAEATVDGTISLRDVVQGLEPMIEAARATTKAVAQ